MSKRGRRIALWVAAGLVVLSVVVAGGGLGLLRSNPSWYERVQLTPAQQAEGQRALLDRLAAMHNQVGQSQVQVERAGGATSPAVFPTIELRITEDEVNGALTRWYEHNDGFRDAMGDLSEPHVRFIKGRVELAGRSRSMNSLISIELAAGQNARGEPTVKLGRPWAGRLPLARSLIDGEATVAKLRAGNAEGRLPESFLAALAQLLDGDAVAPPIVAVSSSFNGERLLPARVEKLSIDGGALDVTLRPFLPGSPSTRPSAQQTAQR